LTPLHWAAMFGLVSTGEILLEAKAPIDAQSNSGETSLHLCAEKGNVAFISFLLGHGAKKDLRDKSANGGQTPFDAAKRAGMKEAMPLLKLPPQPGAGGCCVVM